METIPLITFIALVMTAAASGLIGSFALMRRLTLASDALSHIALPGIAIAFLFEANPFIGGLIALIIGAFIIWGIENRTKIATETIIGVIFSASIAIGALIIPDHELLEALFGNISDIGRVEALIGIFASLAIIAIILKLKERFALSVLSPDLAKTTGLDIKKLNLIFLLIFATTIILGLKFLGVLLMGSLIIIPAASAKNFAKNLNSDLFCSVIIALVSVTIGGMISVYQNTDLGPTIISVATLIFFISVFFKR